MDNRLYIDVLKGKYHGRFLCACCNPWYHHKKHGKPVMHRSVRRIMKQKDGVNVRCED